MAGLGPAIHVFAADDTERRGWPACAGHDGGKVHRSWSAGLGMRVWKGTAAKRFFKRLLQGRFKPRRRSIPNPPCPLRGVDLSLGCVKLWWCGGELGQGNVTGEP